MHEKCGVFCSPGYFVMKIWQQAKEIIERKAEAQKLLPKCQAFIFQLLKFSLAIYWLLVLLFCQILLFSLCNFLSVWFHICLINLGLAISKWLLTFCAIQLFEKVFQPNSDYIVWHLDIFGRKVFSHCLLGLVCFSILWWIRLFT